MLWLWIFVKSSGPGGLFPISVGECDTLGFQTPPFNKARERQKIDPFVRQIREKVGKIA